MQSVWCVVCGVWCVVSGVRCVVCGVVCALHLEDAHGILEPARGDHAREAPHGPEVRRGAHDEEVLDAVRVCEGVGPRAGWCGWSVHTAAWRLRGCACGVRVWGARVGCACGVGSRRGESQCCRSVEKRARRKSRQPEDCSGEQRRGICGLSIREQPRSHTRVTRSPAVRRYAHRGTRTVPTAPQGVASVGPLMELPCASGVWATQTRAVWLLTRCGVTSTRAHALSRSKRLLKQEDRVAQGERKLARRLQGLPVDTA